MKISLTKKDSDQTYLQIRIKFNRKEMIYVCHTDSIKSDNDRKIELFDICNEFFGKKGEKVFFNLLDMITTSEIL